MREQTETRLRVLDAGTDVEELWVPPGKHFERLYGDRKGRGFDNANVQYLICFYFEGADVQITNYHRREMGNIAAEEFPPRRTI